MQPIHESVLRRASPANIRPFVRVPAHGWSLELDCGETLDLRRLDAELSPSFANFLAEGPTVGSGLMLSAPDGADLLRRQIRSARRIALVAEARGQTVACVSVVRRYLTWMRHLAEIDLVISAGTADLLMQHPTDRCLQEVASALLQEILQVTPHLAVAKLIARVPRSIALHPRWLMDAGFLPVASLADWIELEPGRTSDLDLFTLETSAGSPRRGASLTAPRT